MGFYEANLAGFVLLNTGLGCREFTHDDQNRAATHGRTKEERSDALLRDFKLRFLPVYLLVNGADWLQGPYIYPIYKDQKNLSEPLVAALFMTGFLSAAVSAPFIGTLADRYGRRLACLSFCVTYSLSCTSLLGSELVVLLIGRALGGISSTLMYTVFESWMVAEFNSLFPDEPRTTLNSLFGTMATLNSVVAILAGILAEWAVAVSGTLTAPFGISVGCLLLAFIAIFNLWGENYGNSKSTSESFDEELIEQQDKVPSKNTLQLLWQDKRILSLGLTSSVFEGSMYIFIFFKFPALKFSHSLAGSNTDLPFGLIFAAFMCSMMLGSMLYKQLTFAIPLIDTDRLLIYMLSAASLCLFLPVLVRDESITFWSFCLFEVCCGVYFPLMAHERGKIVEDGFRARIYSILRIPLNIFVVVILATTQEGLEHRDLVFTTCSALLLAAVAVKGAIL